MGDWRDDAKHVWIIRGDLPAFEFDAVLTETHTSDLDIMENPVETGFVVADHAVLQPKTLEVYGIVGDIWPGMRKPNRDQMVDQLEPDKPWLVPPDIDGVGPTSRSKRAYANMLGLQESANPFDVQTGKFLYTNMLVKSLSANVERRTAFSLVFRAVLREVIIVSTETATYPPRQAGPTNRSASKKTTSGQKQAVEPPPEKLESFAHKAAKSAGLVP